MKLINIRNIVLVAAISYWAVGGANAVTCSAVTGGDATITTNCNDLEFTGAGVITVNSGVTVSRSGSVIGAATNDAGQTSTLNNLGILDGLSNGVGFSNAGTLNVLTNAGTIKGQVAINTGITITTLNNSGTISALSADGYGILSYGAITTLNNSGAITGTGAANAIALNAGNISNLTNGKLGVISAGSGGAISMFNGGQISTLVNDGTITSSGRAFYNNAGGTTSSLTNSGTISSTNGIGVENDGTINGITNNAGGVISGGAGAIGVANQATGVIGSITNAGTISGGAAGDGIFNNTNTIGSVTNTGVISGGTNGAGIENWGTITTLTNNGSIYSGAGGYGIKNTVGTSAITTLNNGQGGNSSSPSTTALTYTGKLPTNYSVIISSATHFGQLAVTSATGSITTFGIYAGGVAGVAASTLNKGTYSSILSGVAASKFTGATTGKYNGFTWSLSETDAVNGIWNLLVTGASTADTQQSLVNTSAALQNTFTLQNTVLANSFSYDCNVFGANDVCVSAGGRNTQVSAANGLNNTSALLIAAYRVMPSVRVGAYADQNLSVNNAGSTVNLGNNTPLIGLFGAWNERLDGTGTEVKVSAAYGQKNTTVTRQVVGTSEAGSGSSQLNSQGAQVVAKYGFAVAENTIVSPYVGVRYTQNNMNGYSEQATSSVTAPLTYSALNTNATTALAGVGAQYKFIPQATVFASAGVETDTNTSNGTYSATGITGLTPINFNANPVKTRPTATVGAYYDVEKDQRLGITGIYRQEPYQAVQTTTVMATYTVGL
jgi:hypothetical protein